MKSTRLRKIWILAVVIAAVFIAGVIGFRWLDNPLRAVRFLTHFELPSRTKLIYMEREWGDFLANGQTLWVFEIPPDFEKKVMENCNTLGYTRGPFARTQFQITGTEQYYDANADACYLLRRNNTDTELSLISSGHLIVYMAHY